MTYVSPTSSSSGGVAMVVVVNYGSADLVERHLAPLTSGAESAVTAVVVDNFTTQEERERVRAMASAHGWVLVEPQGNLGFGGGVNRGAQAAIEAGAETLVVINPDAQLTVDALGRLAGHVADHPDTLVAPTIRTSAGELWFDGAGLDPHTGGIVVSDRLGEPGIEPWLTGACFALSTRLWERIGGFDDDYFLYWEDVDLSRKVREAGGQLRVLADVTAVHDEGGTQGLTAESRAKSDTYYYYNIRNRMVYARKHMTGSTTRRWLLGSMPQAYAILLRGGRRQFLHRPSVLSVAARAIWDGATGVVGPRGVSDPGVSSRAVEPTTHSNSDAAQGRPLRVLQTYMEPLPFHNPYVKLHDQSLRQAGHSVLHFGWRAAFQGQYDVVHAHWPEDVLEATTPIKAYGKRATMALWLMMLRLRRTPIVRTVHNLDLPSGMDPLKRLLLQLMDRQTDYRVLISDTTPSPAGPHSVVLHGHYRDWLREYPRQTPVTGRLAYIGLIRRYKNVEALARCFTEASATHPEWSLQIGGRPSSDELADSLRGIVGTDPRAQLTLRYLSDAEIVDIVTAAQLVVLPYKEMHNSGSLLTALSLGRPALVPDNAANRAIREEVGPQWVQLFTGELTVEQLERAMLAVADIDPASAPDLSRRDWDVSAAGHVAAYRRALELVERRRRWSVTGAVV